MKLTPQHLDQITGHTRYAPRKVALCRMVNEVSPRICDLTPPHRLALFLSQVLHESGRLRYVKEVWGPTDAQRRYEGRKDLGNVLPGDGERFMGRDVIQVTGRANYSVFTAWVREFVGPKAPDFEANPKKLEEPDWLGWGALWYWTERVPTKYIEAGNIEMITRRVNGGLNGYADRLELYDRAALVFLGYGPEDVRAFQSDTPGLVVDGISGPMTRGAMHTALRIQRPEPSAPPAQEVPDQPGGLLALIVQLLKSIFGGSK